ncbi:MAG: YtpR family tRNA-binding protein, partial [Gemmatimonadota bacterium]
MNVSYRWLKALAPELTLSPQDMAELLALRGAPVEELTPLASDLEGLTVARVDTVDAHPDADLLSVCRVEAGAGPVQVVCGAPNVEVGRFYPFAPVGSTLPGGTEIGRARIRGVESQGMLCSEAELELGPDASGLMALEGDFVPGSSLSEALGMDDWRLDVEITANRGDLLSHAGVVR